MLLFYCALLVVAVDDKTYSIYEAAVNKFIYCEFFLKNNLLSRNRVCRTGAAFAIPYVQIQFIFKRSVKSATNIRCYFFSLCTNSREREAAATIFVDLK